MGQCIWKWPYKPPRGTLLDPGQPLDGAANLHGFYALNEATGSTLADLTGQVPLSINPSATPATWTAGAMLGLKCNTQGAGASAPLPPQLRFGWPLTVACAFRFLGVPGTDNRLFYLTYTNDSVTSPYCAIAAHVAYNGVPYQIYNSGGTSIATAIGPALIQNNDYVLITSISKTSQVSSVFGGGVVESVTTSNSIANPTFGTNPQVCLGEPSGSATGDINAVPNYLIYWAGWWGSFFPASTMTAIGASPNAIWQIFRPVRSIAFFLTPVPVIGTASPTLGAAATQGSAAFGTSSVATITMGRTAGSASASFIAAASAAVTLGTFSTTAAGAFKVTSSASVVLGSLAASATAVFSTAGVTSVTLGPAAAVSIGEFSTNGFTAVTLGSADASAVGVFTTSAAATVTLGRTAGSAAGSFAITAAAGVTLGPAAASASTLFSTTAGAAVVLGPAAASTTALFSTTAGAAVLLGTVTTSTTARFIADASATILLGQASVDGSANVWPLAKASITLSGLAADGMGLTAGLTAIGLSDPLAAALISIRVVDPAEFATDPDSNWVIAITTVDSAIFQSDPNLARTLAP